MSRLRHAEAAQLGDEAERVLHDHVLSTWFPAAIDAEGFHQTFSEDWLRTGPAGERGIVFQSRLTWTVAAAASLAGSALDHAAINRHGMDFLRTRLWDPLHGGFFWRVDDGGIALAGRKHAYGMAFGIYASAASYAAFKDPAALELAKAAFAWLDRHGHDARRGGYIELFERDGTAVVDGEGRDMIGTPVGRKSMNAHLHLLEALSALTEVWPDATALSRLAELFGIVRDRMRIAPGALGAVFSRGFRPVDGGRSWRDRLPPMLSGGRSTMAEQSHGHNLEAAYLLDEAGRRLGRDHEEGTRGVTRSLVDRAIREGFDPVNGGFRHHGPPGHDDVKVWWVQAEALNALLLMNEQYGAETSRYWDTFLRCWDFICRHQIDARHGGWHARLARDGTPLGTLKSDAWTDPYHQARALINMIGVLRRTEVS